MLNAISTAMVYAKVRVRGAFQRVFKEQAGGAEVIATLVIIAVVLALALIFRKNLSDLVKNLWDSLVKNTNPSAAPSINDWGA